MPSTKRIVSTSLAKRRRLRGSAPVVPNLKQVHSEALRQGWLDESMTSPFWLREALAAIAK
jgi:hypothetical protein